METCELWLRWSYSMGIYEPYFPSSNLTLSIGELHADSHKSNHNSEVVDELSHGNTV